MATPSEARAVKSLNHSDEIGRRFVFKKLSQRIAEVNIDVYRSLDAVKAEPSEGSTFFRDCLVEYRELNTAEDFISFYDQTLPLVQTLPQIIFHKEEIVSRLLSRLKMEGRLSHTPILRLLAELARDLLEDFIPFLQRVSESFISLLECGADKDPEIVEEIFTSWSYIMMYLQKYLIKDIGHILRVTAKIRYYSRDYVREFMANSVSFIFRKAPIQQLKKGIRKLMLEVIDEPSDITKSGAAALLSHAVRITSSTLHSNAETLIPLLLDESSFDYKLEGPAVVLDVLILAFQQLYGKLDPSGCKSIGNHICLKITNCVTSENSVHLIRLLTLLIATLESDHQVNISDHQNVVELVGLLVQKFVVHYVDQHSEVINRVLQLMLCLLDGRSNSRNTSFLSDVSSHWGLVFELQTRSLLNFIEDLLKKDLFVFNVFETKIMSALNNLIDTYEEDAVHLMLLVYEKLDGRRHKFVVESCKDLPRLQIFTEKTLRYWIETITRATGREFCATDFKHDKLAILWAVIGCYPHLADAQENQSLLMDLINAVDELLMVKFNFAAFPVDTWHCLIGAALRSHHKLVFSKKTTHDESAITRFLDLAKRYKSSPHVLSAVAGILDLTYGDEIEANATCQFYIPQHVSGMVLEALDTFTENLSHANKEIRLSTLRILCHYEPLGNELPLNDLPIEKKKNNVLYLLRSIEATPISVTSCHVSLISKMEMSLNARRVPEQYMPIVLSGVIGIFHNRFRNLWDPALKCLEVILSQYTKVLWARFVQYLDHFQSVFLTSLGQCVGNDADDFNNPGLVERFNSDVFPSFDSTPIAMVFSLLIQSLQKVPSVADSHSRQVVPLFLKFLGYNVDELQSARHHTAEPKGKEWKSILKEWLNLFRLLQNPKAFYKSQFLKDVLLYRLLDENDTDLQMKVLDCLLNWKDDFLIPYGDSLKNLISTKYVRDEVTRWSLSSNSMNAIDLQHRCDVVPIVIRVLIPKVRNMKMLGSQKNGGNHRKAVLGFLSQLDVHELPLFFSLLINPLLASSQGYDEICQNLWGSCSDTSSNVLEHFTVNTIKSISWKKVCGFLHVIEDILAVFDETRLQPFLNLLVMCVVRILASCTSSLETTSNGLSSSLDNSSILDAHVGEYERDAEDQITERMDVKQSKDLRALCLRIVYRVISKFEDNDFGDDFWLLFFTSIKPLIHRFKQEGASSEKPSSLFHCFLAMSKSPKLVALLFMESNLVPDIFSILTVPSASESILSCVLKFAKNLLKLDSELDSEVNSVKELLVPHLNVLMCSLHSLFTKGNTSKRKLIKSPGKKEFTIFRLLSNYIKEPSEANIFIDMMLPILTKKTLHPDICVEILQIIQQLVALTGKESKERSKIILKSVTPLLITAGMEVRTIICDVLDTLAAEDASLANVAQILGELNAVAEMEIDDLDYDKVFCAYNKINVNFFYSVPEEQALVILSHCIYDMSSKVSRQSALGVLRSFIEFCGMILDGSLKSGHIWSESNIQHVVKNFLLKHMGDAMDKEPPVLQVWFELLKDMVLKIPNVANLGSYRPLCSDDPEQDFFSNLFHLQKHLRARALLRFKNVMGSEEQSEFVSNKVFVPLLFRLLFELQDGKDEHIRSACMQALSFLSSNMNWNQYYALLNRCFRDLKLKVEKQKVILRLICSILDHYHFSEGSADNKSSTHEEHDPYFINVASSSTLSCNANSAELSIMQTRLQKNVLPKIQNLFASDPDRINVYASIVALKVLKLLPADIMDSQLPTIVHRISNFLKNRLESIRDEARNALTACLKELGLEYLQFVVKVLRSTLKRGFELHVLGYTLNFILLKFLTSPICGKLDYCLEDLLSVVENDILGGVSDEKDVDKIASKMKETRKQKSFETLKLIAQTVSFKTHGLKLLSVVTNNLSKQLNQKVKSKFENMLTNIAAGIESNPSVDRTELFVFVYGLIADGISDEGEHALKNAEAPSNRLLNVDRRYSHLITTFSLGVMHNYMKKMKLNKEDEQLLSLLDPFVERLCQCLSSKYESVITGALRCLCLIIKLPLPSLQSQADKIKDSLLVITQGSINANQLTESCVKLLTTLLRSTRVTLSSDQLHMLIQFPLFVDLAKNPSGVALSLLKAIVHRKLVVPEIYDIVKIVAELMVQSQVEQFRKKCSKIFLQFLLGYQLSEKRLQQHLDMLLANLRYEHSTGRESVLEMLHAIIKKFPRNIVDAHSQTMFVHLVVSLANDEDSKVRSMTIVVLKCLISHVNVNSLQSILEYCKLWYFGKKQNLWGAAAQVLGLLVEVTGKGFSKNLKSVLQAMRSILQSAANALRPEQHNLSDEVVVPLWKEAYYSLVMFEKILNQFNNLFFDKDLEDIWEIICQFLLHPRSWVRNISNSLLSQYYSSVTNACRENQEQSLQKFMLMKPSKLFLISVSLCCQLKVPLIEEAAQTLLSQNLVFAICSLHSVHERSEILDTTVFWSALEPAEQDAYIKAFVILDPKKGRRALAYRTSEQIHHVQRQHPFVTYMLQKMGKMCFEMEASQMKVVFDCLKIISPRLLQRSTTLSPVADRDPNSYAYQILLPLYRVQEGYTGTVVTDDVKQVAQKVSESIRDIIGVPNFVQICHDFSKNLKEKREKRKQEVQIMAVVNPEQNAKRKRRITDKHSRNKKRKFASMKMGHWMRSKSHT